MTEGRLTNKIVHLYVFVEMDRLIVDIVPHEEVIDTGQESHLRQGEYVHELFHGVAMDTLQDSNKHKSYSAALHPCTCVNADRCQSAHYLAIEVAHDL